VECVKQQGHLLGSNEVQNNEGVHVWMKNKGKGSGNFVRI
jgi:hypothetical protein